MPVPSPVQNVLVTRGGVIAPLPGGKRLLRDTDLVYLGALKCPSTGPTRMDFSYGQMTGRKVAGQTRLLMVGNVTLGDPVYEFADPGTYGPPATAPRMALVKAWGNIYGTKRVTWTPQGVEQAVPAMYPGGVHWNEATQLLYWTYYNTYNTSGYEDWCLGATRLDPAGPVAFGPWRPSGGGKKGPWRCIRVHEHPSGAMLCGTTLQSGNARSPWGPDLWSGQWPIETTPAGFGAPDLPVTKYLTYYPMIGRTGADGSFTPPIRASRRPGDYFFEPPTMSTARIDPSKNGGVGAWTELDVIRGCAWIDLPDVHGVVFTGMLGAGHIWYSTTSNSFTCSHGVPSPVMITGPVMTDAHPTLMIYDPADLDAVAAGTTVDYTVDAAQVIDAQARYGIQTGRITNVGSARMIAGTYFDTAARKLYIAAPEADEAAPGYFLPLVHVFQVT